MLKGFNERRQLEDQVRKDGRLPPGQSVTLKFPVLHYGPVPIYSDLNDWTFSIFGLVEEDQKWSWEEFQNLPKRTVTLDLHCVTRWSKFDTVWEGVHLQDLIDAGLLKIKPEAKYCIQHCEMGYTTNTSLDAVLSDNFLLAYKFEDKPLDPEHGYPLRGLMGAVGGTNKETDRYLWKGGKWIRGLEFVEKDRPGFWENAGYNNVANVWREERYSGGW
jgi:DMSO/TMAO reductase YedYZ molybdopterin-dependent catalytic subunit